MYKTIVTPQLNKQIKPNSITIITDLTDEYCFHFYTFRYGFLIVLKKNSLFILFLFVIFRYIYIISFQEFLFRLTIYRKKIKIFFP